MSKPDYTGLRAKKVALKISIANIEKRSRNLTPLFRVFSYTQRKFYMPGEK